MSALALTRASIALALAGCGGSAAAPGVNAGETIAGRALVAGRIALLTTGPAVVWIDPATRAIGRHPISHTGGAKLWGLGEIDGDLYTVGGFSELVRVRADGRADPHAAFSQPVGNLIDTAEGMAAQYAVDQPGAALMWRATATGGLTPMNGATRRPLGMSRAEEGVMHVVTCSLPPATICWTPGSNQPFWLDGSELRNGPRLESISAIDPARLLEQPAARVIHDALRTRDDTLIVLFTGSKGAELAEFDRGGKRLRTFSAAEPLRILLAMRDDAIVALARAGRVVEVPR